MAAKRLKLELAATAQDDGWYLILDPTPIPGYQCVVEPSGMDLAEFDAHGRPGLWYHDRSIPPMAQWDIRLDGNRLLGKPTFDAPEDHPMAATVAKLFAAGRLRLSAGLEVRESGSTTVSGERYEHVTKSALSEVSFCLYGAHPAAGLKASPTLALAEAVDDGTITAAERDSLGELELMTDPNTEGNDSRGELELLREENARLKIELAAARNPGASSTDIDLSMIPAPEKSPVSVELVRAELSQQIADKVASSVRAAMAGTVRAAVRKHLGRVD